MAMRHDFFRARRLFRGTDYRGVNERIWSRWIQTYGGGPEVPRGLR